MYPALLTFICLIGLVSLNCKQPHPDEARAKQLFGEINEIAARPFGGQPKEEVMRVLSHINELKKNFPASRDQIMAETRIAKGYLEASIADNQKLVSKYEELLKLRLAKSNIDCFEVNVKVQQNLTERVKLSILEMDLVFDQNIVDKVTFDKKAAEIREKTKALEKESNDLDEQLKDVCSKAKLGVD